ncbi:MAG: DnaJ domain-containing protein [Burkholderiaceae bacterium]|nr:DnaJ domain-containing protein [Burkholderiaceae bacterium]
MADERRNLYRILFVQPEAPTEVIKAAHRALMNTMRAHPDLGGDHEAAARYNAAYHVLGDPERRGAYDRARRRPLRNSASADNTVTSGPTSWLAEQTCPQCQHPFSAKPVTGSRCTRCDSPLVPAPSGERALGEIIGRRRGERFDRDIGVSLRLPGQPGETGARLRDLSLTGLSLICALPIAKGSNLRVVAPNFDAVAWVVACRGNRGVHTVHARLLTLEILRAGRGMFVSTKA